MFPVSLWLAGNKTNFYNKAYLTVAGKNANLVVNLTSTRPFVPNWTFYSQGGESAKGMLTPAVSSMQKLKPKYVRIDHIYDFYNVVSKDSSGNLNFNWSNLDVELKAILAMGATPFISLSYMPGAISSGNEVDLPISWNEWSKVVTATVEHISGSSALAINNVYYEVWNEPDLFGKFKISGAKSYLNLYKYASIGAADARNVLPFKFGGPASTALYKSWFVDFLKYVKSNNLRLDFYSWHRYSPYLSDYETDLANLTLWKEEVKDINVPELVISESGHSPEIDGGYDTKFSAIHTLAILTTLQQKVDKVFTFEIIDGASDKKNWGRWGLLTNEKWGIPEEKSRFAAMQFLNQMIDSGVELKFEGQGDFVKATGLIGSKSIKILLINYDPSGKHFEKTPLTIIGLPEGEYTYRYSEFLNQPYELTVLIDAEWKTDLYLKPNTAVLIELTRK